MGTRIGGLLTGMLACLVLALGTAACGSGDNEYVKDNKVLLETLPVPPQAERVRVSSAPYHSAPDNEYETIVVVGYQTTAVYEVAAGTTDEEIIAFYVGALGDGWEHCRDEVPVAEPVPTGMTPGPLLGKIAFAHFLRGREGMTVSTYGLFSPPGAGTFEVVVDHAAQSNPCTGEDLR